VLAGNFLDGSIPVKKDQGNGTYAHWGDDDDADNENDDVNGGGGNIDRSGDHDDTNNDHPNISNNTLQELLFWRRRCCLTLCTILRLCVTCHT
jgi:hypothetical protein